jgi:HAD superfamily hydrolase (TIGR01549 family)
MAIRTILFDFDGVILDSMPTREKGFALLFRHFPAEQVEQLLAYHRVNGGLSRYHKFRYFYEHILQQPITEEKVMQLAGEFSAIMRAELVNKELLIADAVEFIRSNHSRYPLHIVSGSDGQELRYLCAQLGLSPYFITIEGSPTPKNQLVKDILAAYHYTPAETILIGDSKNDYDAAVANNIHFLGYRFFSDRQIPDLLQVHSLQDFAEVTRRL